MNNIFAQLSLNSSTMQQDKTKNRFSIPKMKRKYFLPVVGSLLVITLMSVTLLVLSNRKETTSDQTKAASIMESGAYANRFQEITTPLKSPILYFNNDHYKSTPEKPATVSVTTAGSDSIFTLTGKSGIFFDNPIKDEPFYKISVTMTDTTSQKVTAYLTSLDAKWEPGKSLNGISAGVNAPVNKDTYYIETTDHMMAYTKLPADKKKWTDDIWSKFIKRHTGDVLLELYVTPIGTYAVIDHYNTFGLPDDWAGRPVLKPSKTNFIVLSKWDGDINEKITFKNLSVTKLDSAVSTVEEVNAFFINKAFKEVYQKEAIQRMNARSLSWAEALWMALLARGYDHYANTPGAHTEEVRKLAQYALSGAPENLQSIYAKNVPRYNIAQIGSNRLNSICSDERPNGWTPISAWPADRSPSNLDKSRLPAAEQRNSWTTIATQHNLGYFTICGYLFGDTVQAINHGFVNSTQASSLLVLGISDYLDAPLREQYRQAFAPVIDRTMEYIFPKNPDGSFNPDLNLFPDKNGPQNGDWFKGDTGMEEYSWLLNFYTGYYSLYYYDNDDTTHRAAKVLEWMIFLDHYGYSEEYASLRQKFGSGLTWQYLPEPAQTFLTKTVWSATDTPPNNMPPALAAAPQRGMMDNHDFHPSANYGIPTSADYASLAVQRIAGFPLPRTRTNQSAMLNNSFLNMIDLTTLRRKPGTIFRMNRQQTPQTLQDVQDRFAIEGMLDGAGKPNPRAGLATDYYGSERPGNIEDWGNSYLHYHVLLAQGDYENATVMARNIYYSQYNSTGRFFCSHAVETRAGQYTDKATCLNNDPMSYLYDGPLFGMMWNPATKYPSFTTSPIKLSVSNNGSSAAATTEVAPDGILFLHTDVALAGSAEVRVANGSTFVVNFTNQIASVPANKIGTALQQYDLSVRPQLDPKYGQWSKTNPQGYPWSTVAKITLKQGVVPAPPENYDPFALPFTVELSTDGQNYSTAPITIAQGSPYYVRLRDSRGNLIDQDVAVTTPSGAGERAWLQFTKGAATVTAAQTASLQGIYTASAHKGGSSQGWSKAFTVTVTLKQGAAPVPPTSPDTSVSFTQQLYREMIGIVPATTDAHFQYNLQKVQQNDCLSAVQNIASYPEYKQRKSTYSNMQFVEMMYRTLLARSMDGGSENGWVKALQTGSQTRDTISAAIYGFPEAKTVCKNRTLIATAAPPPAPSTPIVPTTPDATALYAQQLYREMTGVIPSTDDSGFKSAQSSVTNNNCLAAFKTIASLPGFLERKKNYTDDQFVNVLYRTILSRPIDGGSENGWVKALKTGSQTRDTIGPAMYSFPEAQTACKNRTLIAAAAAPAPVAAPVAPAPVAPAPVPQPDLITLSQVSKRASDGKYKTRAVTSLSQADSSLGNAQVLGKIYSTPGTGRVALHECYFASWDEYIMITSASATRPSSFCPNTTAGWSETYKGVVGYLGASKSTLMTKPFKECFDETNSNHHYAITDPACSAYAAALSPRPSVRESWVYGWVQ